MKLYSVIFKNNGKSYYFNGDDKLEVGNHVIVETEKGMQYGLINNLLNEPFNENKYKNIIRKSTRDDDKNYNNILKDNLIALQKCRDLVKKMDLNMNVISAEFTFDKTQLMFNFVSDERVDFRELAKKLASIYHTRIELRQVGARDKQKKLVALGFVDKKYVVPDS